MGIFKKITDLARANINSFITQIEDPKKLAEQAIIDLEETKKKARRLLVSSKAAQKLAMDRVSGLKEKAHQLKSLAEDSLRNANETEAREYLEKKEAAIQEKMILDEQISKEQQAVETLERGLTSIDEKISKMKSHAANTGGITQIEKEDAFATFSRIEEKIDTTEREVEALTELLKETEASEKKDAAETPATSFDKHSDPKALEQELSAMKKKLND